MKSYDGLDFRSVEAGLVNVPGYSNLHPVRKRRLALLLIKSRWVFDYFHGQDTTLSPKTSAAKLKNLLGSLSLLSNFAGGAGIDPSNRDVQVDPACRDAMQSSSWTADIQGPKRTPVGYEPPFCVLYGLQGGEGSRAGNEAAHQRKRSGVRDRLALRKATSRDLSQNLWRKIHNLTRKKPRDWFRTSRLANDQGSRRDFGRDDHQPL